MYKINFRKVRFKGIRLILPNKLLTKAEEQSKKEKKDKEGNIAQDTTHKPGPEFDPWKEKRKTKKDKKKIKDRRIKGKRRRAEGKEEREDKKWVYHAESIISSSYAKKIFNIHDLFKMHTRLHAYIYNYIYKSREHISLLLV